MEDDKITTQCPHCNQRMKLRSQFEGKKIKCPKCNEAFKIERVADEEEGVDVAPPAADLPMPSEPATTSPDDDLDVPSIADDAEVPSLDESAGFDDAEVPPLGGDWNDDGTDEIPSVEDDVAEEGFEMATDEPVDIPSVEDEPELPPLTGEPVQDEASFEDELPDLDDRTPAPERSYDSSQPAYQAPSYSAADAASQYRQEIRFRKFKATVPEQSKVVAEVSLGTSGLFVNESTKALVTENELFLYTSRRYLLGILPGGYRIGSFPIEQRDVRSAMLKVPSLFGAFWLLVFTLGLAVLGFFLIDQYTVMEGLPTFEVFFKDMGANYVPLLENAWFLLAPFALALLWVLLFWRLKYRSGAFKVSVSRFKKKDTMNLIRIVNEQALKFERN